jgi:hypothetical protein
MDRSAFAIPNLSTPHTETGGQPPPRAKQAGPWVRIHFAPANRQCELPTTDATVLEGAIRSQVNDGPVATYEAGQSFSELPGDRHGVSANASETKPAKLLAVFVVDTNETELTIPFGN